MGMSGTRSGSIPVLFDTCAVWLEVCDMSERRRNEKREQTEREREREGKR